MTLAPNTNRHDRVVITGGGTADVSVAATLLRQSPQLDVAVIDPSDHHYYQTITSPAGRWSGAVKCAPRISGGAGPT